ncbi:hypothetical protein KAU45_02470 [bacterium]|nr:hypothetical protein [bacterium]
MVPKANLLAEVVRRAAVTDRQHRLGKTAVVKLMYLLQALEDVDLDYAFELYTYGPFTGEILYDLDVAERDGLLSIKYLPHAYDGHGGYDIKAKDVREAKGLDSKTLEAIERVVGRFGDKSARDLELITTFIYLNRVAGLIGDKLKKGVKNVKPKYTPDELARTNEEVQEFLIKN